MGSGNVTEREFGIMIIIVQIKETENIIGLKEDIAARLENIVNIERIDVFGNNEIQIKVKETEERA